MSIAPSPPSAPSHATNRRRPTECDDIGRAVNIGPALAASLRADGIATLPDLRAIGALAAWDRLRGRRPAIATGSALLRLEGATRGIRITQLAPIERSWLRSLANARGNQR